MKATATIHMNQFAHGTQGRDGKYVGIYGHLLEPGDVLESTDLMESSSGVWEPCPCPGLKLQKGVATRWVRPA